MSERLTAKEYYTSVSDIATSLLRDAATELNSTDLTALREHVFEEGLIHEAVDGDQWIIYTHYHSQVLDVTDHADAYEDIYSNESLGEVVKERGVDGLTQIMAFYAMERDVQVALDDLDESALEGIEVDEEE